VQSIYARYLTEELGVSPEDADGYLRGRVSGDWSQTDPDVRATVTRAISARAALQESEQEIARLQARRGMTAPVFDQHGNVVMTGRRGDQRPMEVPLGADDPVSTRYVQGANGQVRAAGQPDPLADGVADLLESTGGDIAAAEAEIDADTGLTPEQKARAKALLRQTQRGVPRG
jgi:hypothetical protein